MKTVIIYFIIIIISFAVTFGVVILLSGNWPSQWNRDDIGASFKAVFTLLITFALSSFMFYTYEQNQN